MTQSMQEDLDQVGRGWEYALVVSKALLYLGLVALCREYEEPSYFITGYFLADFAVQILAAGRNWRGLDRKRVFELLTHLAVGGWILLQGKLIPEQREHVGMLALAFVCFFLLKFTLLGLRNGGSSILGQRWKE